MQSNDLSWLAGLLEGEGHFGTTNDSPRLREKYPRARPTALVSLKMVDYDVVSRAASLMGGPDPKRRPMGHGWQDQWSTQVSARRAADLMEDLLPLMGIRRQARISMILSRDLSHRPREISS